MKYEVTTQTTKVERVTVEAESLEAALAAVSEGKGETLGRDEAQIERYARLPRPVTGESPSASCLA